MLAADHMQPAEETFEGHVLGDHHRQRRQPGADAVAQALLALAQLTGRRRHRLAACSANPLRST